MKKNIFIAGTGGFAKEILHLIYDLGRVKDAVGFVEPDFLLETNKYPEKLLDKNVLPYSILNPNTDLVSIGIGNPNTRQKIVEEQLSNEQEFISLIHPSVKVSPWISMGNGAIVCANSIITVDVEIGIQCQLNLATTIGHDCKIGDYFTTAPGVHVSGECVIGNRVYIGTGAVIKQGLTICDNVTIGMGAVVTKNITAPGVYAGVPAVKIK